VSGEKRDARARGLHPLRHLRAIWAKRSIDAGGLRVRTSNHDRGDIGAGLPLGSGGICLLLSVRGRRQRRKVQTRPPRPSHCDEEERRGKNHEHGALPIDDGGYGGAAARERCATAWAGTEGHSRGQPTAMETMHFGKVYGSNAIPPRPWARGCC